MSRSTTSACCLRTGGPSPPCFKAALKEKHPLLFEQAPPVAWTLNWVADVQPVGSGEPALKYLAAYVYRTALGAERILADDGHFVTFTYKDGKDGTLRTCRLPAESFLHRFLQHVLPRGLQRIRHFGFLGAASKAKWQRVLALLDYTPPPPVPPPPVAPPLCPLCNKPMVLLCSLPRPP